MSNFASSFVVRISRFAPKGAKLQEKSAYVGHADVIVERTNPDADFGDLVKGAFIQVTENLIALPNIAIKILPNAGPYLQVPQKQVDERWIPLFRPASAEARAFLTEEVFADENVGETAARFSSMLDQKLATLGQEERSAPQTERSAAPAQESGRIDALAEQVSKLTMLVASLAEHFTSSSEDPTCSEDELPY